MRTRAADSPAGRFEHALLPPHEADGYTSDSAPYAIGVAFTGQSAAVVGVPGSAARTLAFAPGTVGVNGPRPLTWLRTSAVTESVEVVPSAAALARAADEHGVDWSRLGEFRQHGHDPVVWAAGVRVRRLLADGLPVPAEEAEEVTTGLLAHVATTHLGGRATATDGSLDLRRLRRVTDRVHAAPFAAHPLHELAAAAHLSPYHFLRTFARRTGMTPHRYVTAVRAELARRRLAREGATVAAVAAELGIDPRQLRRLHRQAFGRSPRGR